MQPPSDSSPTLILPSVWQTAERHSSIPVWPSFTQISSHNYMQDSIANKTRRNWIKTERVTEEQESDQDDDLYNVQMLDLRQWEKDVLADLEKAEEWSFGDDY